jgi:NADH:ubiquinone oxidoreductase subunit C
MKTCLKIKKTRLIIWYILKKAVLNLKAFLGVGINNIRLVSGFEIGFDSLSKNIYPIILFLKKNTISQCYIITDIICYDYINNNKRYSLVYNIVGLRFNIRIRIRTKLSSVDKLLSLVSLYNSVS